MNAVTFYNELFNWLLEHVADHNMFMIQFVATCSALIWLLFRAWQTLWKPVPELISILGVEVPDPPKASLAGIKSDSITLYWSRPDPQKPVIKYYIQVNGLNVGETSRLETAITVTGLRPVHFYNITVISVGSNNFQVGSLVIRLRTCGKDGRPIMDDSLDNLNLASEETDSSFEDDSSSAGHGVCVEATALPEGLSSTYRERSISTPGPQNSGQRRNTVSTTCGRKHSLSTTITDSVPTYLQTAREVKESVQQLNEQLERINQERNKVAMETAKEIEEFNIQLAQMCRDRDEKKIFLKDQEEASEKLRKEVNNAERLNRQAQIRKSQKEKLLKEKNAERSKMEEDMKRWRTEIEEMKIERVRLRGKVEKFEKRNQIKLVELKDEIKQRQTTLNLIEEDIRVKGLQIKELELYHKSLTNFDEGEEARLRDEYEDREWDSTEKALTAELNTKSQQLRDIGTKLHQQQAYLSALQQRSSMICHGYYSNLGYDSATTQPLSDSHSNHGRNSQAISPTQARTTIDPLLGSSSCNGGLTPNFAPGPYIQIGGDPSPVSVSGLVEDLTDEDYSIFSAGAPLSPSATSLLPSNIFSDDDPPSPLLGPLDLPTPALPTQVVPFIDNDQQSLPSPNNSTSLISGPQIFPHLPKNSTQDSDYLDSDRQLLSPRPSISDSEPAATSKLLNHKGLRDIFSLPRSKSKDLDQDGPGLRLLKPSECHSFPRLSEDEVVGGNKPRRISFPSGWTCFLHKSPGNREVLVEGRVSADVQDSFIKRSTLEIYDSIVDDRNPCDSFHPSSPPSRSAVSFDLPSPSTHSAPFGWGPAQGQATNRSGHLSPDWSLQSTDHNLVKHKNTWSSCQRKRTSLQLGLSQIFPSRNSHENEYFLPPSDNLNCQTGQSSSITPIGTRQSSSSQKMSPPKLNPAAPVFEGFKPNFINSSKPKNDRNDEFMDTPTAENSIHDLINQTDVIASIGSQELHDLSSKNIHNSFIDPCDVLGHHNSQILSEMTTSFVNKQKEETSFQRLFRKTSSSKFSISSLRNKDSGLFSARKSLTTPLERNDSLERIGSIDRFSEENYSKSYDSVNSSPIYSKNTLGECTQFNESDHLLKEGRISMNWGRFGIRSKKGKESLGIFDLSEDVMTSSENMNF